MIRQLSLCVVLAFCVAGCPKKETPAAADASAALPSASASSSAVVVADAGADKPSGATGAASSFSGKYTVTAGTMYIPATKDWSSAKFKNDESKLLGDGDLTLNIDGAGMVTGTTESGPLGPSDIRGESDGKTLSAAVRRKDASDDGLTGTLVATLDGSKLDGTMKLADGQSTAVRAATFSLAKK